MRLFFKQTLNDNLPVEEDLVTLNINDDIKKTRYALETAYAGFDNATDPDLIDCYIYEVNSILKRYEYLLQQAQILNREIQPEESDQKSPVFTLLNHVFG